MYTNLINRIKFIFSSEDIEIPDNKMDYINYNIMYFTIIISNYGSFDCTIIITTCIDGNIYTKIYINYIVEPEHILDFEFKIDPKYHQDIEALDEDYYLKNIYKEGNIETVINAIWFTPFWKKRMPDNKNYIVMN